MSGRGNNRDNGMSKWFGKYAPSCFNPAKEQDGRSGDGSDTARTPRMIQRREDTKGKSIAVSSNELEGDVAAIEERTEDRKGKGIAYSSNEEGDVAGGSNRGVQENVVGSSSGGGGRDNGGMFNWFGKCVTCINPANEQVDDSMNRIDIRNYQYLGSTRKEQQDAQSFWSRDLDSHYSGSFSIAVIQANKILEDYSQVEVGKKATFVGIYDGHGGTRTAEHVCDNLTNHLMGLVRETKTMSVANLTQAFLRTEDTWVSRVNAQFEKRPVVFAACGSCCLVGVVWKGNLYVANVGDSRAIIGRVVQEGEGSPKFTFHQLTRDDNVKHQDVREEVQSIYPDDPDIVIKRGNSWYIKGKLQVSKAIGDEYLKIPRFSLDKYKGYRLNKPIRPKKPAVTAQPTPTITPLGPQDRFVIFASDGLWDQLSNREAVDIVYKYPHEGIAARLIREALDKAANKNNKTSDYLLRLKVQSGLRRQLYFDDMTVVVLFLNEGSQGAGIRQDIPLISVKGGKNQITEDVSSFTALDELPEGGGAVASSSGGGEDTVPSSNGGGEDAVPSLSGGGEDAVPSLSGGGGDAVPSLSGGEGDVASGGEEDVAS